MTPQEEMKEDEDYLDTNFPKEICCEGIIKPKSRMRGQAMVLLALARDEGMRIERQRLKKLLNDATHWMYYDSRHWVMRDMILEFLEDEK